MNGKEQFRVGGWIDDPFQLILNISHPLILNSVAGWADRVAEKCPIPQVAPAPVLV